MAITKQQREKVEATIYNFMDKLDTSKTNTEYYKNLFAKMSDKEFEEMFQKEFPLLFHHKPWVVEPTMGDIKKALDTINVPMTEKVSMPHIHVKDGKPFSTHKTMVLYIHHKCMQQFGSKKNAMSTDISKRDQRTGLLVDYDKNGKTSDREMESIAVMGLDATLKELSRPRADAMESKAVMYNIIGTKGTVRMDEVNVEKEDSLAKNMMNVYMLGACLNTNLVNTDMYLPYTLKERKRNVIR